MRQLIVNLRVELPTMSLREIAEICEALFDRRPSHNSVKVVLASPLKHSVIRPLSCFLPFLFLPFPSQPDTNSWLYPAGERLLVRMLLKR